MSSRARKYGPSKQKWPEEGSNSSLAFLYVFPGCDGSGTSSSLTVGKPYLPLWLLGFIWDQAHSLNDVSSASQLASEFVHTGGVHATMLVLLLFQECGMLLNPWEIEVRAAAETVLWDLLNRGG